MTRREAIRNSLMSLAISLVPEILRPVEPVVIVEERLPQELYYEFEYAYDLSLPEWPKNFISVTTNNLCHETWHVDKNGKCTKI